MASRNPILHNFGWKVLSLVLAALTWLTIETDFRRQERTDAESRQAPVTTTSHKTFPAVAVTLLASPTNTNHYRLTPETAQVEIGGDEQALRMLSFRDVQAFVDLSDVEDEKQFRKPVQIRVPRDFIVVSIDPTNLSVERITASH